MKIYRVSVRIEGAPEGVFTGLFPSGVDALRDGLARAMGDIPEDGEFPTGVAVSVVCLSKGEV